VQWCVPAAGEDDDAGVDADELGDADVDVVRAVVATALVLLVEASATPVPPAPSPAATTPVIMSRRARPPILETIEVPPFSTAAAGRDGRLRDQPALPFWPAAEAGLSALYDCL
jgi:hypothetical protein